MTREAAIRAVIIAAFAVVAFLAVMAATGGHLRVTVQPAATSAPGRGR